MVSSKDAAKVIANADKKRDVKLKSSCRGEDQT